MQSFRKKLIRGIDLRYLKTEGQKTNFGQGCLLSTQAGKAGVQDGRIERAVSRISKRRTGYGQTH